MYLCISHVYIYIYLHIHDWKEESKSDSQFCGTYQIIAN